MWSNRCVLFLLAYLLAVGYAGILTRHGGQISFFEDQFKKTIKCVKKQLAVGVPDWSIPPLDPWKSDKPIDLNLNNKFIRTKIILNNATAEGLASSETTSLTLSPLLRLDSIYRFSKFRVSALYSGNFNLLGILGFYGNGIMDVELENIVVDASTQYQMVPPLVGSYYASISVGKLKINITGVDGDEDFSKVLSGVISHAAHLFINILKNNISDMISPIIKNLTNDYIGNLSFLDFLAVVTEYSCE